MPGLRSMFTPLQVKKGLAFKQTGFLKEGDAIMNKKITAMAVVLAMAGMAQAVTESYGVNSVTFSDSASGVGSVDVSVPQFNNLAGGEFAGDVLNSVTLSLVNASETVNLTFVNGDGQTVLSTVTLANGAIDFGSAAAPVSFSHQYSVPSAGLTVPGVVTGTGTGNDTISSSLAGYQGSGTVGGMQVAFVGTWNADGFTNGGVLTSGFGGSADWSVTYNYSPIPEPCSMALFGVGAGVLALRRRFGKNKKA
jgi:hypothetical protein